MWSIAYEPDNMRAGVGRKGASSWHCVGWPLVQWPPYAATILGGPSPCRDSLPLGRPVYDGTWSLVGQAAVSRCWLMIVRSGLLFVALAGDRPAADGMGEPSHEIGVLLNSLLASGRFSSLALSCSWGMAIACHRTVRHWPVPPNRRAASAGLGKPRRVSPTGRNMDAEAAASEQSARQQVRGPAIGLLVDGNHQLGCWFPLATFVPVLMAAKRVRRLHGGPRRLGGHLLSAILFLVSSLLIFAALKMKRLKAYGLAIAASILAIIVSPSNLIGLPIGIWALVVLSQRDVRAAFRRRDAPLALPLFRRRTTRNTPTRLVQAPTEPAVAVQDAANEEARLQVQGPAIGLLVTGILNAVATLAIGMLIAWYVLWGVHPMPDLPFVLAFPFVPSVAFTIVIIVAALECDDWMATAGLSSAAFWP